MPKTEPVKPACKSTKSRKKTATRAKPAATTKLAPCPFCGGTNYLHICEQVDGYSHSFSTDVSTACGETFSVVCRNCGARGPEVTNRETAVTAATTSWNTPLVRTRRTTKAKPIKVILASSTTIVRNPWSFGNPPGAGYYLASWRANRTSIVSELWYNPGTGWWSSRGYLNIFTYPNSNPPQSKPVTSVYAWMTLPEPMPFG